MLIQKSTGMVPPFMTTFFLRLKCTSGYMGAVMNKQIWRIHYSMALRYLFLLGKNEYICKKIT